MRLILKGGVWKNSEDEILKAAVMKYGLNQWSRVASLLPRKTPKQCKARWQEWLDPSIRKTEWTREEEERLLHLAKLMPAQWRTIAPLVGRTPAQCLEHYEKLLDAAQGADAKDKAEHKLRPGEIDPMPEVKPARPDPVDMDEDEKEMLSEARARLANTQGKKAKRKVRERMLEEAKRLAQLQKLRELKAAGINVDARKKKKKGNGIDYANEIPFEKVAPAGFFDTGDDDVRYARDKAQETAEFKTTLLNKIETERASAAEARARAEDKRKFKAMAASNLPDLLKAEADRDPLNLQKRAPLLMPAPSVTDAELEDIARIGMQAGNAGVLGGGYNMLEDGGLDGAGSVVTTGLLGQYGGRPEDIEGSVVALAASRRGATAPTRDAVMEEARNQAARLSMATPLLGGDNISLEQGTGYAGAQPQSRRVATTTGRVDAGGLGYGATPMIGSGAGAGPTPMIDDRLGGVASVIGGPDGQRAGSVLTGLGSVAGALRLRDAMGINRLDLPAPSGASSVRYGSGAGALGRGAGAGAGGSAEDEDVYPSDSASVALGDSASVRGDPFAQQALLRQLSSGVAAGLAALPKPKQEYELTVPELPADDDGAFGPAAQAGASMGYGTAAAALRGADLGTMQEQLDAEETAAREAAAAEAQRQAELARRSSALKHEPELPRPLVLDDDAIAPPTSAILAYYSSSPAARAGAGAGSSDPVQQAALRERATAESLINDEMLKLLKRDAVQYPISHKFFRPPKRAPMLDDLSDEDLASARELLSAEEGRLRSEAEASGKAPSFEDFERVCEEVDATHVYIPSTRSYIPSSKATPEQLCEALKLRFESLQGAFNREADRLAKMEDKLTKLTKGYEIRNAKLEGELAAAFNEAQDASIRVACVSRLASDEKAALPVRLAQAQALLQEEVEREKQLQQRYAAAVHEMDVLRGQLGVRSEPVR